MFLRIIHILGSRARGYLVLTAALTLAISGAVWLRHYPGGEPRSAVYRIGFGNDVPFQFKAADGTPAGVAVEIVKEAARRRGIQLKWIESAHAGIGSILTGETDLWVLLTDLPERRRQIYITEPYLTTERCFLVLKDSNLHSPQDLTGARIAYREFWSRNAPPSDSASYPNADEVYLRGALPNATLVPIAYGNLGELLQALKERRAEAGLLNKNVVAALLQTGGDRGELDIVAAPQAVSQLALASSFATRSAADQIRDEIRAMAEDGAITRITQPWGFFQSTSLDIIRNLSAARQASRLLAAGMLALGAATLFISFLALRLHRQRNTVRDTQAALHESEGYYRSLVELVPDTIYGADAGGHILQRGHPAGNANGKPDVQFLELSESHREKVAAACRMNQIVEGEEKTPDGRIFEYRLVPVETEETAADRVVGILRDVTAARLADNERRRLLEERQEASRLESLGRLAGGVAHDFNNLLTVINGYASLLIKKLTDRPDLQSQVDEIRTAGVSATTLTEQLLAFSQKRIIKPEVLDLNQVVRTSARMLEKVIGAGIALELDLAPDLNSVTGTVGSLQQVLINLTANARDAMPRGGRLIIRTCNTDKPDVRSQPDRPSSEPWVALMVQDTGDGIPAELAGRVFEPFFTTKEQGKGTGLGLATVYGIVKQQGGSITVESDTGSGTTFRILFPAAQDPRPGLAPKAEAPAVTLAAVTILLAEDNPEVRRLAAGVLRSSGSEVLEAANGAEAVRISTNFQGHLDLLVSDMEMPGMSGPELAERLRVRYPGIQVLFMTGHAAEAVDCEASGGAPSLLKPFPPERLLEAVSQILAAIPPPPVRAEGRAV